MRRALRIILAAQCALGLFWTMAAAMAHGAGGLAVVGFFLVIYAIFAAMFLVAAWAWWKHPDARRIAGWIMALPVVFWFLPHMIRSMAGGVLTTQQFNGLVLIAVLVAAGVCWFFPRRAAVVVPDFLAGSRLFNWLALLAQIAGWVFFVAMVTLVIIDGDKAGSSDGTAAVGFAIVLAGMYLISLGLASFGLATWAWVSLRGGFDVTPRKLNIAQLVVAAPGVLSGVAVAVWLSGQGQL